MVISSFNPNTPDVQYITTITTCTCPDKSIRHHDETAYCCKHMRLARRIEQGRPTNVDEARAARLARRQEERETRNCYMRMQFQVA